MTGRSSWLVLLSLLLVTTRVRGEPLTEASLLRRVSERSAEVTIARGEVALAEAAETEARLYPNPSVAWTREHLPGEGGAREDVIALSLPLDLSGRRSAARALARAGTRAALADTARTRSAAVLHALETFYAAIAADARAGAARDAVDRLAEAVRVLGRRQEEGNVAGYERVRLELELELAESQRRNAEGEAEALRLELAAMLGLVGPVELRGELGVGASADHGVHPRATPSLELSRSALREAQRATESAASSWLPVIELSGGMKAEATDRTRYGYVAGVNLEVPVFSRGQELRAAARAEERLATARTQAAERARKLELERATLTLARAGAELARFDAGTRERLTRLVRSIQSGYREGTRSLGDLLDAEGARAAIEQRRLELLLAVTNATLALRAARGEFE